MMIDNDYLIDLNKIKETIRTNQNKAMVVVNSTMIKTYYEIGIIINKRKPWGNKYIENLANDLKEYGSSYSFRNLKYMSQFAKEFHWGTLITVIIPKSKSHEEMLLYINETYKKGWSRSMVLNQVVMKAYERNLINPITTNIGY